MEIGNIKRQGSRKKAKEKMDYKNGRIREHQQKYTAEPENEAKIEMR